MDRLVRSPSAAYDWHRDLRLRDRQGTRRQPASAATAATNRPHRVLCHDNGLASASMTLASMAKPSPLIRPASMQARTTASKTWRKRSLSRERPGRFTEKVE